MTNIFDKLNILAKNVDMTPSLTLGVNNILVFLITACRMPPNQLRFLKVMQINL